MDVQEPITSSLEVNKKHNEKTLKDAYKVQLDLNNVKTQAILKDLGVDVYTVYSYPYLTQEQSHLVSKLTIGSGISSCEIMYDKEKRIKICVEFEQISGTFEYYIRQYGSELYFESVDVFDHSGKDFGKTTHRFVRIQEGTITLSNSPSKKFLALVQKDIDARHETKSEKKYNKTSHLFKQGFEYQIDDGNLPEKSNLSRDVLSNTHSLEDFPYSWNTENNCHSFVFEYILNAYGMGSELLKGFFLSPETLENFLEVTSEKIVLQENIGLENISDYTIPGDILFSKHGNGGHSGIVTKNIRANGSEESTLLTKISKVGPIITGPIEKVFGAGVYPTPIEEITIWRFNPSKVKDYVEKFM